MEGDVTARESRQRLYRLLEELPFEERRALAARKAPRSEVVIAVNASRRARAHPRRMMVGVRDLSMLPSERQAMTEAEQEMLNEAMEDTMSPAVVRAIGPRTTDSLGLKRLS